MKLFIQDLVLKPDEANVRLALAQRLGLVEEDILALDILKKSLDARKKQQIIYRLQVAFDVRDHEAVSRANPALIKPYETAATPHPLAELAIKAKTSGCPPIIIGSGPAGQSAAFLFAEAGIPCLVIERGQAVEQRVRDVNHLRRDGQLNPESNYCYGEGGAGTFSDGKLTCGRRHPLIRYLFESWVRFGAPPEILWDSHPHIGTDYLLRMTKNMRQYMESRGTRFLFGSRMVDLRPGKKTKIQIELADGQTFDTDHLILATGHSARETYQMLWDRGVSIQQKPFAMGVRVEHPQDVIDTIQYGTCHADLGIPAAEYKLAAHEGQRGIWTFCMCPGGHLLPTSAEHGHLAINGMSYHARASGFANAALVVNILREDYDRGHPLDGMHFQAKLERAAYEMGGGNYACPAQRLQDFVAGRPSSGEMKSTYKPKIVPGRLDQLLPDFVVKSLQAALFDYNKRMRGFMTPEALIVGLESKTSAPVVIQRDKEFQSLSHPGLYPTGEGAGFAGGIVSAGLDGLRVAQHIIMGLHGQLANRLEQH